MSEFIWYDTHVKTCGTKGFTYIVLAHLYSSYLIKLIVFSFFFLVVVIFIYNINRKHKLIVYQSLYYKSHIGNIVTLAFTLLLLYI